MKHKILLTGFEPFGGEKVNPSWEAVKQLNGMEIEDVVFIAEQIPTVFKKSIKVLEELIERYQPELVIAVGQAGGRLHITPERVAVNLDDARIPDNEGNQPIDEPVSPEGPAAYWTGLPVKRMVEAMKEHNIPASVSHTAGTFVCNHIFYGLMDYISRTSSGIRGGFIHIPFLPEQTIDKEAPSLSLETITEGIKLAALTAVKHEQDIRVIGGITH
ncbi:pyroglutamyl-peptidase I [Peribacillus kribbensis]|uniref:pyroglutamyl-peptidase I n=1 Tax=Peribacillus kribbensis TaxID=356658 RepID=UPI0003FCC250|nr:pyroglutamyl-peptidase I [Peribacillus kribbensis]